MAHTSTQLTSCSLACETVAIHQPLPPHCAVVQSTHLILTSNQTLQELNVFSCSAPDITLTASRYHLARYRCCPGVSTTTLHTSLRPLSGCVGRPVQSSPLHSVGGRLVGRMVSSPSIYLNSTSNIGFVYTSSRRLGTTSHYLY